jgi:hypothetical protein
MRFLGRKQQKINTGWETVEGNGGGRGADIHRGEGVVAVNLRLMGWKKISRGEQT